MNNIVDGSLNLADLKHVVLPQRDIDRLQPVDGDVLFNRTNSKELVGKCAVFREKLACVFASYLIRVRISHDRADPEFVAYVINGPVGRQQIDAVSRQIIGQANVNSRELRSLRVPLPPLEVQKSLISAVADARRKTTEARREASERQQRIGAEIETGILGPSSGAVAAQAVLG